MFQWMTEMSLTQFEEVVPCAACYVEPISRGSWPWLRTKINCPPGLYFMMYSTNDLSANDRRVRITSLTVIVIKNVLCLYIFICIWYTHFFIFTFIYVYIHISYITIWFFMSFYDNLLVCLCILYIKKRTLSQDGLTRSSSRRTTNSKWNCPAQDETPTAVGILPQPKTTMVDGCLLRKIAA